MKSMIHECQKNNKKVMSKNSILKTVSILALALLTFSCGKDDAPAATPLPTGSDYFLKAKVDGAQYQTDAAFRVLTSRSVDRITVGSTLSDNRNFELKVDGSFGVGTFNYPSPSGAAYDLSLTYGDASSSSAIWKTGSCTGTTGTLTITALSATEISGTFSFTGKRTGSCADAAKTITEGSFKSGIIQ